MSGLLFGVALITGAGSGIGQATAVALARHGVEKLAILDVHGSGLEETESMIKGQVAIAKEVLKLVADVSSEDSISRAIETTVKAFGRIDIAVNIAGIAGPILTSTNVALRDFRAVIDVNMTGLWLSQREELKQMLCQDFIQVRPGVQSRGVIVNMSSVFGLTGAAGHTPAAPYNASKHGVVAITKNDSNTYAKDGIRINAICPGYVETKTLKGAVSQSEVMKKELEKVPMGRLAAPDEIAETIVFLASPMSSFITGASIIVDGGYMAN